MKPSFTEMSYFRFINPEEEKYFDNIVGKRVIMLAHFLQSFTSHDLLDLTKFSALIVSH